MFTRSMDTSRGVIAAKDLVRFRMPRADNAADLTGPSTDLAPPAGAPANKIQSEPVSRSLKTKRD